MTATSILKIIGNFYETELDDSNIRLPINCAEGYLTLQSVATFHPINVFFFFSTFRAHAVGLAQISYKR